MHYFITYLFYKHIIFYIESNPTGCLNNKVISNYELRGFSVQGPKLSTVMEHVSEAQLLPVFTGFIDYNQSFLFVLFLQRRKFTPDEIK